MNSIVIFRQKIGNVNCENLCDNAVISEVKNYDCP